MKISLVTLVKGRNAALQNTLRGISLGTELPDEVLIVHMNEAPYPLIQLDINIRQERIDHAHQLPLAAARNKAMQMAKNEHVIFLDVDCIPDPQLITQYKMAFVDRQALFSGQIRYIPQHHLHESSLLEKLWQFSNPDPIRGHLAQYPYELFWSLNFACTKTIFNQIGGFDEGFEGYGAEDTDFGFAARKNGVKMVTINAPAYHQPHASYDPPLNHLKDIVANAIRFKAKWNLWPMEGWLNKFEAMGYIRKGQNDINILQLPSMAEIEMTLKPY